MACKLVIARHDSSCSGQSSFGCLLDATLWHQCFQIQYLHHECIRHLSQSRCQYMQRTLAKHASSCSLYWVESTLTPENQAHETDLAGNENAQTDRTASATCANTIGQKQALSNNLLCSQPCTNTMPLATLITHSLADCFNMLRAGRSQQICSFLCCKLLFTTYMLCMA